MFVGVVMTRRTLYISAYKLEAWIRKTQDSHLDRSQSTILGVSNKLD